MQGTGLPETHRTCLYTMGWQVRPYERGPSPLVSPSGTERLQGGAGLEESPRQSEESGPLFGPRLR